MQKSSSKVGDTDDTRLATVLLRGVWNLGRATPFATKWQREKIKVDIDFNSFQIRVFGETSQPEEFRVSNGFTSRCSEGFLEFESRDGGHSEGTTFDTNYSVGIAQDAHGALLVRVRQTTNTSTFLVMKQHNETERWYLFAQAK